jgi:hypothetical protein
MKLNRISKTIIIFILCFFVCETYFGQNGASIAGKVINAKNEPMEYVSVALLNHKDSTLVNFTTTNVKGDFSIINSEKDPFILQVSSIGYLSFFKDIVYNKTSIDLGTILLKEKDNLLNAVIISAVVPISIKDDTITYNAGSFKINPSDNIVNLLKKLPGLDIDSNGKIIAQGEEVTKIFVDGKEFFGGDPSLVIKNLPADAIDKIEIVDKNSNQTELTGIDDGNKQIVINFTLKKTNKEMGFGKLSGGIGLDSRYFGNLNYNRFSSKNQFSVIGKFNNINITGSNLQSFLENANGIDDESDDESDDEDSNTTDSNLSGFLTTAVTGVNYGYEFKENESFNADYSYNMSYNKGLSNSKRISLSNSNRFNFNADNAYDNTADKHNLNINYKNQSNKMNSLFIRAKLLSDKFVTDLNRNGYYFNEFDELTTTNDNILYKTNDKRTGNIKLKYYQKLNKEGRSFNTAIDVTLTAKNKENEQNTFINRNLNSTNPKYTELFTIRNSKLNTSLVNYSFKYTEPLFKNNYLKLESYLNFKSEKEDVYQLKTIVTNNNKEELFAYQYINKDYSYITRLAHSYTTKTVNIYTALESQNLNRKFGDIQNETISRQQVFLNPIMSFQYKPKRGRKFKLTYKKIVRSPRLNQSSTVINDLNPFFIKKGNPDLKTEKRNLFSFIANVNDFKTSLNFHSRIQFELTKDAIIQIIDIADDFVKTRTYQNNGNRKKLKSDISFGKKINGLGLRYTLKNKNIFSTSNSVINLELNDVVTKDFLVSLTLENYNKNNLDVKAGLEYSINNTSFSIENNLNRTYTRQQYYTVFDYNVSPKLTFNTQFDYIIYSDNKFSNNIQLPILNTAISYAFSENKNHILKLVLIDLLDKNIDIYRTSRANFFEETTSESLGRYVILSYTYKLNGVKKRSVK